MTVLLCRQLRVISLQKQMLKGGNRKLLVAIGNYRKEKRKTRRGGGKLQNGEIELQFPMVRTVMSWQIFYPYVTNCLIYIGECGGAGRVRWQQRGERFHKCIHKNYVAQRLKGWLKATSARKFKVKAESFSFNRYTVLGHSS